MGMNCDVSHFLNRLALRSEALPFDWNVTPLQSAIELINNEFDEFLDLKNLIFLSIDKRLLFNEQGTSLKISEDWITPVVCSRYGMLFPHDFSKLGHAEFSAIKDKYNRRIERFKKIMALNSKKFFIYHDSPLNDWQEAKYKTAGIEYKRTPAEDLKKFFSAFNFVNSELISLDEFKSRLNSNILATH